MTRGWQGESQRHSMSRKGVRTKNPDKVIWFTSRGVVSDVVSLLQLMDFSSLMKSKGYKESEYTRDARKIAVLPASEAEKSVEWLEKEWGKGTPARRRKILHLAKMTRNRISLELLHKPPPSTQAHLRKSHQLYGGFVVNHGGV